MARMASFELDGLDAPACPLLGLLADRRTHFTYPHPGHRCYVIEPAATTDAGRQVTYCLNDFTACDRYQAHQHPGLHAASLPGDGPKTTAGNSFG